MQSPSNLSARIHGEWTSPWSDRAARQWRN